MKNKLNILAILILIFYSSCGNDKTVVIKEPQKLKPSEKIYDTITGCFYKYPIEQKVDYLEIEYEKDYYHFTINNLITRNKETYLLDFYSSNENCKGFSQDTLVLGFGAQDVHLDYKIDSYYEKKFGKTNGLKFVVKFFLGNKCSSNYEYIINPKDCRIILKNIYLESHFYRDRITKDAVPDTVATYTKIPINEEFSKLNKNKLDSISSWDFGNYKRYEKYDIN